MTKKEERHIVAKINQVAVKYNVANVKNQTDQILEIYEENRAKRADVIGKLIAEAIMGNSIQLKPGDVQSFVDLWGGYIAELREATNV